MAIESNRLRAWWLLAGVGLLAASPGAWAQQSQADDTIEEIVVTGTRIRQSNLTLPSPVSSVDSEDIEFSGDVNAIDIVDDIPALIGSDGQIDNSIEFGTFGAATLDLRNLGPERTLVLVDGRRHVAGVAGEATVDVNSIPPALIERVEVLTGGASSIYGADAVTGVVNFILKDDFEGLELDIQANTSDEGDGEIYNADLLAGGNFADGRGNATFSLSYEHQNRVEMGDRSHTRGDRLATDWPNPAFRIQQADVAEFGLDRLLLGQSVGDFCAAGDTTLGSAKSALCGRIEGAPDRAVMEFPRFAVSNYGSIIGVDFFGDGFLSFFPDPDTVSALGLDLGPDGVIFDTNGNGVEDCFETAEGTVTQRFGGFAGCHVIDGVGTPIRPFSDGLIADSINQFGGDGTNTGRDGTDFLPRQKRWVANATTNFEIVEGLNWFAEAKFVYSEVDTSGNAVNSFYDSIPIRMDNPFIPDNLRGPIEEFVAANPGVFNLDDVIVFIGRDPTDMGPNKDVAERQTVRVVTGFEGLIPETTLSYEVAFNYGRTDADTFDGSAILMDRLYAALDAVVDPATGDIVCRSSIETDADGNPVEPGAAFLPSGGVFPGFNTFDPGDGSCVPLNFFGIGAPGEEAVDFVTTTLTRTRSVEQIVASGFVTGDSSDMFSLPAGPVGFAVGAEYREERSSFDAPAEEERGEVFDPRITLSDVSGEFDVWEVFGEVSVPVLTDMPFARELSLNGAVRFADYSTVGKTTSWSVGAMWAPVEDLRFRGTFSRAIRAPNISELFSPLTGTTDRPIDPCDSDNLNDGTEFRAANCAAAGIPAGFSDPLTARISGFTGGNPELEEEQADTFTVGLIVQPRFAPGLAITADFYSIEIDDAIDAPNLQEIVDACYDLSQFPNQFCEQFTRDQNPASPTFLGVNGFETVELNFVKVETEGVDYTVQYDFELGQVSSALSDWGSAMVRVHGNYTRMIDRFEDPNDPSAVNEQLLEFGQPEHTVNLDLRWFYGNLAVNLQSRYIDEVLEITPRLQIENADQFLNAFADGMWRHDLSAAYQLNESLRVYGGVNNLTDEDPIASDANFPVGFMGRQFFLGVNMRL